MEIFLDNRPLEWDEKSLPELSFDAPTSGLLQKSAKKGRIALTLPATAQNRQAIGFTDQVNAEALFNQSPHRMELFFRGFLLAAGRGFLKACVSAPEASPQEDSRFEFLIDPSASDWVGVLSSRTLRQAGVDYNLTLTSKALSDSWKEASAAVRFLPVARQSSMISGQTTGSVVRVLTYADYHPFVHCGKLLKAVFKDAGYSVRSAFVDSPWFDTLYMSGNYSSVDTDAQKSQMDFRAGRAEDKSTTADYLGFVVADPGQAYSSVGNLVETAVATASQNDLFNTNGCFALRSGRAAFVPTREIDVAFEYKLHYRTAYTMLSREELSGFNRISLDGVTTHTFKIPNRNPDMRQGGYNSGTQYRIVVFNHVSGRSYQLRHDVITNPAADPDNLKPGDATETVVANFSARTALVTPTASGTQRVANPRLYYNPGTGLVPYTGDWAVYYGYVAETGTTDVEVTLQSQPVSVSPASPYYFDRLSFGGAPSGTAFTLSKNCRLRPLFGSTPGEGTKLTFPDVMVDSSRQIDFVNALVQMFNLRIAVDELSREAVIEPADSLSGSRIFDWSGKIDRKKPVVVAEAGSELPASFTLRYKTGDLTSEEWNAANGEVLGRKTLRVENLMADQSAETQANPLFVTTVNARNLYPDAVRASLMQVRTKAGELDPGVVRFPPRIVRYLGLASLPSGQLWGWPTNGTAYPLAAFHLPPESAHALDSGDLLCDDTQSSITRGSTLCFEDRDNLPGLHRLYAATIGRANRARRISLYVDLSPADIEALGQPTEDTANFSALYRLEIGPEPVLCRLERVTGYKPDGKSTLCTFITD